MAVSIDWGPPDGFPHHKSPTVGCLYKAPDSWKLQYGLGHILERTPTHDLVSIP